MVVDLVVIALLIIAGISDAFNDTLIFKPYLSRLPRNWDPKNSWKNKWKLISKSIPYPRNRNENHWWYLGLYKPEYNERFPFSSTLLVSFTDPWHMFKSIKLNAMFGALVYLCHNTLWQSVIIFVIYRLLYGITFEIFFKKLLIK